MGVVLQNSVCSVVHQVFVFALTLQSKFQKFVVTYKGCHRSGQLPSEKMPYPKDHRIWSISSTHGCVSCSTCPNSGLVQMNCKIELKQKCKKADAPD